MSRVFLKEGDALLHDGVEDFHQQVERASVAGAIQVPK